MRLFLALFFIEGKMKMRHLVDKLALEGMLSPAEFKALLEGRTEELEEYLFEKARGKRKEVYGTDVYIRGLIEFTNYCKQDCYYCGIRRSNTNANRYRLTEEEILECCKIGRELGFYTYVLQGGEDAYYTEERIVHLIRRIKDAYPDSAITLSIGEWPKSSYQAFFDAGADRYLLRHETANDEHYSQLHPSNQLGKNRKQCLFDLKEIGFQVGCGLMVGSPFQTIDHLVEDLLFIKQLHPHMVGIGPFIPHHDTPFASMKAGTVSLTLCMLALVRLMLPDVLLPSTTALGTIDPLGREKGILAGGNVVMPNLSPTDVRNKYLLYDNKICTGDEAAECRYCMQKRMETVGYHVVETRGDHKSWSEEKE